MCICITDCVPKTDSTESCRFAQLRLPTCRLLVYELLLLLLAIRRGWEGGREGSSFRNECAQGETVRWIVRSRLEWFARVNQGVFKECARARQVDGINFLLCC